MCIIIDANVAHEFVGDEPTEAATIILDWIKRSAGIVATGRRVREELLRTRFRGIYQTLLLAGRLYQYHDAEITRQEAEIQNQGQLVSDDPHVIALSIVSGCRLLFSRDQDLHVDFCNNAVLVPR